MIFTSRCDNILLLLYAFLALRQLEFSFGPKNRSHRINQTIPPRLSDAWREHVFGVDKRDQISQTPDEQNVSSLDARVVPDTNESLVARCIVQPNQPLSKLGSAIQEKNRESLSERKIDKVFCMFLAGKQVHFPHAMQQLYRCYSLWMQYPEAKAILLAPNEDILRQLYSKTFTRGIIPIFHQQMNMSIIVKGSIPVQTMNEYKTSKQYVFREFNSESNYDIQHVAALHRMTERNFQLDDSSALTCRDKKPRVGILNRKQHSGRCILNASYIASLLGAQGLSRNNTVVVKYFDGVEFEDQVVFFRSIDILISPHGAQLTGVAFMNAPCAHLVELFPKGYKLKNYFGSLALRSQKDYSYIYMSANASSSESAKTRSQRIEARKANLCPSATKIADTTRKLVEQWKQCCERRNSGSVDLPLV